MEISLIIALSASIIINILVFWYMRRVIPRLVFMSRNLEDLTLLIINYRNHLKSIYQMEMYYGDETLKFLISHTNSLLDVLEDYEDIGLIIMPEESESEEENIGEQQDAETQVQEENVFYAGSRKRDN